MAEIRVFTKREYDSRIFSYDVSGKLRKGDTVSTFDSATATAKRGTPAALNVSPHSSEPITDDKILNFTCDGGEAKSSYTVSLRFTPTSADTDLDETRLEVIVEVSVV